MRHHAVLLATLVFAPLLARAEDAPVSLTASDGTGLSLVSYQARAVVEDPLAFTELTLVFENPRDRVIEGQFRVTLPRGATVSRFAMKQDERWQEGEMVEKQAARRAYEDFLHRRQDPALLEQAAGNEFSARVFPIPAKGRKSVIVSWSHELPKADAAYVLPLKGLPQVGSLSVSVSSGGKSLGALEKNGFVPSQDFSVQPPRTGRTGVRAGEYVVTRVKAVAASSPEPLTSALLLVDTSASRALGYGAQVTMVQKLVEALAANNPGLSLTVAAFDQAVAVVHEGPATGFGAAAVKALKDRKALGASDVSGALQWALERGKKQPVARVVLVTDGVFTAGEIEGDQLMAVVARLKDAGVQRLDAVAVGGIREEGILRRLVTAKLPHTGALLDGDAEVAVNARRLGEATVAKVPVTASGAKVVWPLALEGVQAGDEAVVVLEGAGEAPRVMVGSVTVDLKSGLVTVEKPLLERAWAQARIQQLLDVQDRAADGQAQKQKLRDEMIALSTKHRVLSPYTALLVLETEADYARFHIDRKSLADVLGIEAGRVVARHRAAEVAPVPVAVAKAPEKPRDFASERKMMKGLSANKADEAGPSEEGREKEIALEAPKGGAAADMAPPAQSVGGLAGLAGGGGAGNGAPAFRGPAGGGARSNASAGMAMPVMAEPEARPAPRPAAPAMAPPPPSAMREESRREAPSRRMAMESRASGDEGSMPVSREPWEGPFKEVMVLLAKGDTTRALDRAKAWREEQAGDVLALVALGEACEAVQDVERAGRAYGSIIDLFPARADLRRFAGVRLERLKGQAGLKLAADTFAKAAEQRPDHPASHRMLAFALVKQGQYEKAFAALEKGLAQQYPEGRFARAGDILREDLGLVAAAWMKAQPGVAVDVKARLAKVGARLEDQPSLRFVLTWETDANDVDFHIYDAKGGHAFYSQKQLASGGELYADVTTGYGPECFTIRKPVGQRAAPYTLRAHYYSRGPMGYGMGKLEIIDHDGKGGLTFEERPYVVMVDQAFVDLGKVAR